MHFIFAYFVVLCCTKFGPLQFGQLTCPLSFHNITPTRTKNNRMSFCLFAQKSHISRVAFWRLVSLVFLHKTVSRFCFCIVQRKVTFSLVVSKWHWDVSLFHCLDFITVLQWLMDNMTIKLHLDVNLSRFRVFNW